MKNSSSKVLWNKGELLRFLRIANSKKLGLLYEIAISTGLRLSEILALTWEDIDFDKELITVKSIAKGGNVEKYAGNHRRKVLLLSYHIPKLMAHKENQDMIKEQLGGQYNGLGLVFPRKDGRIQNERNILNDFNRIIEDANIKKISFYGLRKMTASTLFNSGVSIIAITHMLGYSSVDTTLKNVLNGYRENKRDIQKS